MIGSIKKRLRERGRAAPVRKKDIRRIASGLLIMMMIGNAPMIVMAETLGGGYTDTTGETLGGGYTDTTGGTLGGGYTDTTGGTLGGGYTDTTGGTLGGGYTDTTGGTLGGGYTDTTGGTLGGGYTDTTGGTLGGGYTDTIGGTLGGGYTDTTGGTLGGGYTDTTGGTLGGGTLGGGTNTGDGTIGGGTLGGGTNTGDGTLGGGTLGGGTNTGDGTIGGGTLGGGTNTGDGTIGGGTLGGGTNTGDGTIGGGTLGGGTNTGDGTLGGGTLGGGTNTGDGTIGGGTIGGGTNTGEETIGGGTLGGGTNTGEETIGGGTETGGSGETDPDNGDAGEGTQQQETEWQYDPDDPTIIIGYSGTGGNLTIPDGVTTIADNAFDGCTDLESITIPSSVTSIGNGAFNGCGVTTVIIPCDFPISEFQDSGIGLDDENITFVYSHHWESGNNSQDGSNSVTVSCTNKDSCQADDLYITISAPESSVVYNGSPVEVTVSGNYGDSEVNVIYKTDDGSVLQGKPVNAGHYTADVTVAGEGGLVIASVDYTIEQAVPTIIPPTLSDNDSLPVMMMLWWYCTAEVDGTAVPGEVIKVKYYGDSETDYLVTFRPYDTLNYRTVTQLIKTGEDANQGGSTLDGEAGNGQNPGENNTDQNNPAQDNPGTNNSDQNNNGSNYPTNPDQTNPDVTVPNGTISDNLFPENPSPYPVMPENPIESDDVIGGTSGPDDVNGDITPDVPGDVDLPGDEIDRVNEDNNNSSSGNNSYIGGINEKNGKNSDTDASGKNSKQSTEKTQNPVIAEIIQPGKALIKEIEDNPIGKKIVSFFETENGLIIGAVQVNELVEHIRRIPLRWILVLIFVTIELVWVCLKKKRNRIQWNS